MRIFIRIKSLRIAYNDDFCVSGVLLREDVNAPYVNRCWGRPPADAAIIDWSCRHYAGARPAVHLTNKLETDPSYWQTRFTYYNSCCIWRRSSIWLPSRGTSVKLLTDYGPDDWGIWDRFMVVHPCTGPEALYRPYGPYREYRYSSTLSWPKVKVKCTLVQALRLCTGRTVHRGSRGIALLFHDQR